MDGGFRRVATRKRSVLMSTSSPPTFGAGSEGRRSRSRRREPERRGLFSSRPSACSLFVSAPAIGGVGLGRGAGVRARREADSLRLASRPGPGWNIILWRSLIAGSTSATWRSARLTCRRARSRHRRYRVTGARPRPFLRDCVLPRSA